MSYSSRCIIVLIIAFLTGGSITAQEKDSLTLKELLIPAISTAYGASSLTINPVRDIDKEINVWRDNHIMGTTHIDDITQYAPLALAIGLNVSGHRGKSGLKDMMLKAMGSQLVSAGVVHTLKASIDRQRPNGRARNAFPSGHTTTAFMAAEILHQEYGDHSLWYSVGGYTLATATGILRVYNDKHWLSDVAAGAGIGMLCTKLTYWIYPKLFPPRENKPSAPILGYTILPSGHMGVALTYEF